MSSPFSFYYMRPDQMMTWDGSAVGNVDSDYAAAYSVDGIPGRPFLANTLSVCSLHVIGGTSMYCNALIVSHHNVDAARLISVTGDLVCSLAPGTLSPYGVPKNPWVSISSVLAGQFTLAVNSNTAAVRIGEVFAGLLQTMPKNLRADSNEFEPETFAIQPDAEFESANGYDKRLEARKLSGWNYFTDAQLADLQAWYDSTRQGTRPTVIIPIGNDPSDAWVVKFTTFSYQKNGVVNRVQMGWREIARGDW